MNLSIDVFGVRFADLTLDIRPAEAVEVDRIARRGCSCAVPLVGGKDVLDEHG
ncbi:DUF7429 family protein [Mycobacteroides abscessus]|uniref:DUF7429 family protein n=1 Tax=Mycobacteroides abscessus TaxID=36809 RepID=UPI004027E25D